MQAFLRDSRSSDAANVAAHTGWTCSWPVRKPTMIHRWEQLTFLHWRQDPERVQRLLPAGLVVDTCDGAAWVSVVPFRQRVRLAAMPYLPWLATFRQMNVRTYVRGPDGQPAVWFLSIDAERLGAAVVARWSYGIPYMWARMRMETAGDIGVYGARRRWPGPAGARCHIAVRVGPPTARRSSGLSTASSWCAGASTACARPASSTPRSTTRPGRSFARESCTSTRRCSRGAVCPSPPSRSRITRRASRCESAGRARYAPARRLALIGTVGCAKVAEVNVPREAVVVEVPERGKPQLAAADEASATTER